MSLVGFAARNHPQQVVEHGRDVGTDDRATVAEVFGPLDAEFGPFTLDVAATAQNTKCSRYFDAATDGLAQSWGHETVWCNPPFSSIEPWVRKAWHETHRAAVECDRVVMLLPANRTEQRWWQELVEPYRDRTGSALRTRFLPGRVRFLAPGESTVRPGSRPPFGCVLLIFDVGSEFCPRVATLFEVAL